MKEETAVKGELPILSRGDKEALGEGRRVGVRFTHHIECEKRKHRGVCDTQGKKATDGKSKRSLEAGEVTALDF